MKLKIIISAIILFIVCGSALAEETLAKKLSGRILLQVESHGEAWYVNPVNQQRYSLGRPYQAFAIMRQLGIGITDADLNKIPVGPFATGEADNDFDGIPNNAEAALGTNPNSKDSDNDGYEDVVEITNGYDPNGSGRLPIDLNFTKKQLGKIFLQVGSQGEAWYVNPIDQKRYYLGSPDDAFVIMRNLGLGITNVDLEEITAGQLKSSSASTPACDNCQTDASEQTGGVLDQAATAIRANDVEKATGYFTPALSKAIEYTMDYLDADGRLTLANILSGSSLNSSTEDEKIYKNEVYFSLGGYNISLYFHVKKQPDGSWLIENL